VALHFQRRQSLITTEEKDMLTKQTAFIHWCFWLCLALDICGPALSASAASPSHGSATIYFFRPTGVLPGSFSPNIKIDGRVVGELRVGQYFSVSIRAGHHAIEVRGGLDLGYESDLQVESGRTYYIGVGPKPAYGLVYQALTPALAGNTGTQMSGHGIMASYTFYFLEAEQGREAIAKLRHVGRR
jgi:hypothetical protein